MLTRRANSTGQGREKVLLVEDDMLVRMLGVDVLEEAGYEVIEAPNGDVALDVIDANPHAISVLMTDIDMPGSINGHQLARLVNERWPWIRIVLTSGKTMLAQRDIPDHGRFVAKPWLPDTIVHAIRSAGTPGDV